jgi:hypothetical protein
MLSAHDTNEAVAQPCEDDATRDADAAMTRIARLVAALKAEREAGGVSPSADARERDRLTASLRQFVAAHEQERHAWQEAMQALRDELDEVRAAALAAQERHEQMAVQQQRAMADLALMHEHQRSIWQLDRRRLEITIAGHEQMSSGRGSPLAIGAALLLVVVVALTLVGDQGARAGRSADAAYVPASGSSR